METAEDNLPGPRRRSKQILGKERHSYFKLDRYPKPACDEDESRLLSGLIRAPLLYLENCAPLSAIMNPAWTESWHIAYAVHAAFVLRLFGNINSIPKIIAYKLPTFRSI